MQNPFIKQLIWVFVLPNVGLISVFTLVLLNWHSSPVLAWVLLISIPAFLLMNFAALRYFSRSYKKLESVIRSLDTGKSLTNETFDSDPSFGGIISDLNKVSLHLDKQQEELRQAKIISLRSVIDGQDIERQRLSRELHDGIGQSLIAVKLQLENAGSQSHSHMRASTDVAMGMIDQTIDEIRRVTNALLPAALNEFGLVTALRTRCEEMANAAKIELAFEHSGSVDKLENKSKTYLYRIAQEAITNTIKHARASKLTVKLQLTGQEVILVVSDNGKGFIFEPTTFAHRNGIQNIRERIALLNGSFEMNSKPDHGTTLRVTIPYQIVNGKNTNHSG